MKTFYFLLALALLIFRPCSAQKLTKPPLDTAIFKNWPQLMGQAVVSPNGKNVIYFLSTQGHNADDSRMVITSSDGSWKQVFLTRQIRAEFNLTSTHAVAMLDGDSVVTVNTLSKKIHYLKGVSSYKLIGDLIYYQTIGFPEKLMILNLDSQEEKVHDHLSSVFFKSGAKEMFLLETKGSIQFLKLAGAKGVNPVPLWSGKKAEAFTYDPQSSSWAFLARSEEYQGPFLWSAKSGLKKLQIYSKARDKKDFFSMPPIRIYDNGNWIILREKVLPEQAKPTLEKSPLLNIWNFQGSTANGQSGQRMITKNNTFAVNTLSGQVCNVTTGDNERIVQLEGKFALIDRSTGGGSWDERTWNKYGQLERYLVDLTTGKEQRLPDHDFVLANRGGLLLGNDWEKMTYIVLETESMKKLFQTSLPTDLRRVNIFYLDEARAVCYQDDYDIWKWELEGKKKNFNITAGYGRNKRIIFTFLSKQGNAAIKKQRLYLSAQDESTRANGFYLGYLNGDKQPEKLIMGDFAFSEPSKNGEYWTWKQSFSEKAPNVLVSKDLKQFKEILTPKPENSYNWIRTELHHYKLIDGRTVQGILYKPEDFDDHKKYPMILYYYQRLEDWLHSYPDVSVATGPVNIPWMVSHGYLVFVPDIINQVNRSMASATDCILSATDYLQRLSFVEGNNIGVSGHSFGGYTTLAAITRTNRFAAAFASSPPASAFSSYFGVPNAFGQFDITSLPWEDRNCYIENSPLLFLNQVTTPVLIMGNRGDALWPQPMEFFYGLRRLGKAAWMLEYHGQGHTISGPAEIDRTLRVQQFFDYYLKSMSCPLWMSTPGSSSLNLSDKQPNQTILSSEAEEAAKKLSVNQ